MRSARVVMSLASCAAVLGCVVDDGARETIESATAAISLGSPTPVGACTPNRRRVGTPSLGCETVMAGTCRDPGTTNIAPGPLGAGITVLQPPGVPEHVCADLHVDGMAAPPKAVILVDQSGSMATAFGPVSRWTALYQALFDGTSGVVTLAHTSVELGIAFYSTACNVVGYVPPAISNLTTLRAAYMTRGPTGTTATAAALRDLRTRLPPGVIIILATDGEPNTCGGRAEVEAEALAAHLEGNDVYALSLGDAVSTTHLDTVVRNGTGNPTARSIRANNRAELTAALAAFVGHAVAGCDALLSDAIDDPDDCTLRLDGVGLVRNDPNGWLHRGGPAVTVQGIACRELQEGGVLEGTCTCGVPPPLPAAGSWTQTTPGPCTERGSLAHYDAIHLGWSAYDETLHEVPGGGGARIRVTFAIALTEAGLATAPSFTVELTVPNRDVTIDIPSLTGVNGRIGSFIRTRVDFVPSGYVRPVLEHFSVLYECRPVE